VIGRIFTSPNSRRRLNRRLTPEATTRRPQQQPLRLLLRLAQPQARLDRKVCLVQLDPLELLEHLVLQDKMAQLALFMSESM
jgi:hypothetical protein